MLFRLIIRIALIAILWFITEQALPTGNLLAGIRLVLIIGGAIWVFRGLMDDD